MTTDLRPNTDDPFLLQYSESELRIASEFLETWLPFLSKDLCRRCTKILSDRVRSLSKVEGNESSLSAKDESCCDNSHSLGSWKDEAEETNSVGSCKDGGGSDPASADLADSSSLGEIAAEWLAAESSTRRKSWADMAQEDELEGDEEVGVVKRSEEGSRSSERQGLVPRRKTELSRDQREYLRFMNVKRKKDFICLERVNGKIVNIVKGLELHTGVFSAVEQKRIVEFIGELQQKGKRGEFKERTFTAPRKWMRGKGRETIQFGCCYNYSTDKNGNPPGILRDDLVDPIPPLFKVIIKRLVKWHVLPPLCVPDSCIVNIYEEGDCIPPHIDNHDFVRPFCTISFVSECEILFGAELKVLGPGEFSGDFSIPLPVGSVLVLNGNGADVAKHCVPAVPSKRISITFRRMDENKRPDGYMPEPDLQGLEPLCYETETKDNSSPNQHSNRQTNRRGGYIPPSRRMDENKRPDGYMPEQDLQGLEPLCYETETKDNSSPTQHSNRQTNRRGGYIPPSRRMDENKRPDGYMPEPDLQGLEPLCYETETKDNSSPTQQSNRQTNRRGGYIPRSRRFEEPRYSSNDQHGSSRGGFRTRANRGS